jgi:hypothetical protein
MEKHGRSAVSEFLGDNIVYRNLVPVNRDLPGITELWEQAGLVSSQVPRKTTTEYARLVVCMLEHTAGQRKPGSPINNVVFIGDTHLNDGTAFNNICLAGEWPGIAFIAAEKDEPRGIHIEEKVTSKLMLANRWSALDEFDDYCVQQEFHIDEQTVVLLDLDKTTLGARGRNDKVIDQVRIMAANQTIHALFGEDFDEALFTLAYRCLNQPEFHPFTGDNQDYLVYICMILGSGLTDLDVLVEKVRAGEMRSFVQFLSWSEVQKEDLPAKQRQVHDSVYGLVKAGDPTPFKDFRRQEFKLTVASMGNLPENSPVERVLQEEITITQEVRQAAIRWREQGALLFGLSDKPDEASIPDAGMISKGLKPIHQVETDVVGG